MQINVKGFEFEIDDKFLKEYEETMYEKLEDNIECYACTIFRLQNIDEVFEKVPFYKIYHNVIFSAFQEMQLYKGEI